MRRDKVFRDEAKALGWCAIVALGYEAGSWLKISVTEDLWNVQKAGQSYHPFEFAARIVRFAVSDYAADLVYAEMMSAAEASHQRLKGACVAMPVAAAIDAMTAAAVRAGVTLMTLEQWQAEVERRIRRGV